MHRWPSLPLPWDAMQTRRSRNGKWFIVHKRLLSNIRYLQVCDAHEEFHTPALGVPGVHHVSAEKRFQILKLKFTAYPLMKLKFKGVFELPSTRSG